MENDVSFEDVEGLEDLYERVRDEITEYEISNIDYEELEGEDDITRFDLTISLTSEEDNNF